jgi:endo-1,4-beta-xylanase
MKKYFSLLLFLTMTLFIIAAPALRAQSSVLSYNFEGNTIGDSFAHIGWSPSAIQAVVAADPLASGNKVLKNTVHDYNAAPVLQYILPAGKTLADFSSFTFKGFFAKGDVGYKDIVVEAYQTMPTAQFTNNASAKIGLWNRAKAGSTDWENIIVDITNTSSFHDTVYLAFGINCAGTGDVGVAGDTTVWYADSITVVPKPSANANSIIAVSTHLLDFGNDTVGIGKKLSVIINSKGTDTLKVTAISSTNPLFTFSPAMFAIAPSDSSILTITFTPIDTFSQSGFIIVTHNAAGSPDSIAVKGKGIQGTITYPIVTNWGFESSDTGAVNNNVKGWLISVGSGVTPPPLIQIVSDTVEAGNRALKVTVNAATATQWDIQAVADSIRVKPGGKYQYSIWAKAEKAGAQVNFTMGYYSTGEIAAIRPATLSTKWQKYSMQFTVSNNEPYIRGPVHFSYPVNVGNIIYIDNLQIVDADAPMKPVVVEAESGKVGINFSTLTSGNVTYVTTNSTWTSTGNPGDSSRTIKYQVTFPDSGNYNLFARVRVGPNNFNDDSFFYGNGFGTKDDTSSNDWVFINGIASGGFSDSSAWVDGAGSLGSNVWKWANITKNTYSGVAGAVFYVHPDSLTKTFEIASREDGLDIDKIAFGKNWLYFTVGNLDNIQAGSTTMQTKVIDSTLIWKGPALAAGQAKFLGNVPNEPPEKTFTNYWTQLTPGNAGKWGSVAGAAADTSKWNWSVLDAQYNYAITNHLVYKHHTLIWGGQQPSWISGLDSASQYNWIETWIKMVGERYPKIDMVDVVNEPNITHNPPDGGNGRANYIKALGGTGTTGWDWVINAFKLARKYMPPTTKLLVNDYGIINDNAATYIYLQLINLLKAQNLIDGIGVQGHRFELESADTAVLTYNLNRLGATGLPVYISEFDLGNVGDAGTPNDNQQLQLYKKIFPVLWKHPAVKGITLWGYTPPTWQVSVYLVNSDGTGRPALFWLAQFVKDNPTGVEETAPTIPSKFALEQNFPNPFNPATSIRYSIAKTSEVSLTVFDMLGRQVQTLAHSMQAPGEYTVTFNAQNLASGIYFYQLRTGRFTDTKKLMLLK